jgi:hypothetical protein
MPIVSKDSALTVSTFAVVSAAIGAERFRAISESYRDERTVVDWMHCSEL